MKEYIKGNMLKTPQEHRQFGSSGFDFEDLQFNPDLPCGIQMNQDQLQTYYDDRLATVQQVNAMTFLSTYRPTFITAFMYMFGEFEADLEFLNNQGIDVSAAKRELASLIPRLQTLLPEE